MVDLLGMLSGIGLCTLVGTSRQTIVAAYVVLSLVDIAAIYNEIRAVCFSVLNHERTHLLARDYVASGSDPSAMARAPVAPRPSPPLEPLASLLPTIAVGGPVAPAPGGGGAGGGGGAAGREAAPLLQQPLPQREGETRDAVAAAAAAAATVAAPAAVAVATGNNGRATAPAPPAAPLTIEEKEEAGKELLSSPSTVSRRENIFLSSRLTTDAFKTWSQVRTRVCVCVLACR